LISYAGGPTEYADLGRVKVTRPGGGVPARVDIRRYLDTGDEAGVPALQPGDTVYVPRNTKYAWREFVGVVSELAVIAGTVLLYIEVAGRDR
jgi:protein involved in polysaccharide export with SLBB domain